MPRTILPPGFDSSYVDAAVAGSANYGINVAPHFALDADRVADMSILPAASFSSGGGYLAANTTPAAWDFSSVQKFSVEFWRLPGWSTVNNLSGIDNAYISVFAAGTSGANAFSLGSGGSAGQGNSLRMFLATNSSASTYEVAYTPANGSTGRLAGVPFSHGVFTYDGSQGTATNRPHFYMDAVDPGSYAYLNTSSVTTGAGLPTNPLAAASGSLRIGANGGSFTHRLNGSVLCARIYKNKVLSQNEVTTLYNAGAPRTFRQLRDSGFDVSTCTGAWDLGEPGGFSRADASGQGNHLAETGGTVPQSNLVTEVNESGKFGYTLKPPVDNFYTKAGAAGVGSDFSKLSPYSAWLWEPAGLNGLPCFYNGGQANLHVSVPQALNLGACDIFAVYRFAVLPTAETFLLSSAGEVDQLKYFCVGWSIPSSSPVRTWVRQRNPDNVALGASVGTSLNGATTSFATNTTYVHAIRVKGTGDAASYESRVNGVAETLSYANSNAQNSTPNSVYTRDNISVGTLCRQDGPSTAPTQYRLAKLLVYPQLTDAQFGAVEAALRTRYAA